MTSVTRYKPNRNVNKNFENVVPILSSKYDIGTHLKVLIFGIYKSIYFLIRAFAFTLVEKCLFTICI